MSSNRAGVMTSCPLVGETAPLCRMSAAEHLVLWQQLFQALPQAAFAFVMAFAVILLSALALHYRDAVPALSGAYRRYTRDHPNLAAFDCFRLAVSDGILHPRLYI